MLTGATSRPNYPSVEDLFRRATFPSSPPKKGLAPPSYSPSFPLVYEQILHTDARRRCL